MPKGWLRGPTGIGSRRIESDANPVGQLIFVAAILPAVQFLQNKKSLSTYLTLHFFFFSLPDYSLHGFSTLFGRILHFFVFHLVEKKSKYFLNLVDFIAILLDFAFKYCRMCTQIKLRFS